MVKTMLPRRTSLLAKDKGKVCLVDRISELPDDILVSILSLLTLKQAAATSIISSRWRYLWTSSTNLIFPSWTNRNGLSYIDWVDSVVQQHRGSHVQNFSVFYNPGSLIYRKSIINWIQFAEKKGAQSFKLMLGQVPAGETIIMSYASPQDIEIGSALNHLCSEPHERISLHPCAYTTGFKGLKAIKFVDIEVGEKIVECFMSNCSLLERLSVHYSRELEKLRVVGPSLKYLDIHMCMKMKNIDISDSNLVSFSYAGHKIINLVLKNVPFLTEVSISYSFTIDHTMIAMEQLSCCVSQLEVLKLRPRKLETKSYVLPMLVNLRHLELSFEVGDVCCVVQLASFLQASPYLRKLVLKLKHYCFSNRRRGIEIKQAGKYTHSYLRVVEVEDYFGRETDFELVIYLIENAIDLEKLVLKYSDVYYHSWERIEDVRRHARLKLAEKVPSTMKLVYNGSS